jgi:hypothetical protein
LAFPLQVRFELSEDAEHVQEALAGSRLNGGEALPRPRIWVVM